MPKFKISKVTSININHGKIAPNNSKVLTTQVLIKIKRKERKECSEEDGKAFIENLELIQP